MTERINGPTPEQLHRTAVNHLRAAAEASDPKSPVGKLARARLAEVEAGEHLGTQEKYTGAMLVTNSSH